MISQLLALPLAPRKPVPIAIHLLWTPPPPRPSPPSVAAERRDAAEPKPEPVPRTGEPRKDAEAVGLGEQLADEVSEFMRGLWSFEDVGRSRSRTQDMLGSTHEESTGTHGASVLELATVLERGSHF